MSVISIPYLEILFSRVLHDLVSPVSAVNNGVEFLRDMGDEMGDEALDLIGNSAHQASVRLQAFRLAYGAGGSEEMVSGKTIYEGFLSLLDKNRFSLEWDLMNHVPDEPKRGYFKLLMNGLMLLLDMAPKGGVISVVMDDSQITHVTLKAEMIIISDDMRALFNGAQAEVNAKTIHAYATNAYAAHYGFSLALEESEGQLSMALSEMAHY